MELLANKYQVIVSCMKKRAYDFLDQRRADFDEDFIDFRRHIDELHVRLVAYLFYFLN